MSEKLEDKLPIKDTETGILIKVDRVTGEFECWIEGVAIEDRQIKVVLKTLVRSIEKTEEEANPADLTSDDGPDYN